MRRIVLNNALADYHYALANILRDQGKLAEANAVHDRANHHWCRVVEEASDLDKT